MLSNAIGRPRGMLTFEWVFIGHQYRVDALAVRNASPADFF